MYYVIRKAVPVIRLALLALGAVVFAASGALGQDKPKRFLEVTSQGYSRYEISGGDVVAFFTGGVQCSYLGYTLIADELRYNHATQVASADGKIKLTSAALSLECETVTLDGAQGELLIDSPVSGSLAQQGLSFNAGSAVVHFPPGQIDVDPKQISIELNSAADQGVKLAGPNNSVLEAGKLAFDGAAGTVDSPGPFTLDADISRPDGGELAVDVSHVRLTGSALRGTLDGKGMLNSAVISEALLDAGQAKLSAPELTLQLELPNSATGEGYVVTASGTPVSGETANAAQSVAFTAEHVQVVSAANEISNIELSGEVMVDSAGSKLTAELIQLQRRGNGFAISAPNGLQVAFDLASLSGNGPVELPELGNFAQRE
jgi:hypothetical protein